MRCLIFHSFISSNIIYILFFNTMHRIVFLSVAFSLVLHFNSTCMDESMHTYACIMVNMCHSKIHRQKKILRMLRLWNHKFSCNSNIWYVFGLWAVHIVAMVILYLKLLILYIKFQPDYTWRSLSRLKCNSFSFCWHLVRFGYVHSHQESFSNKKKK